MKLMHFSATPVESVYAVTQQRHDRGFQPKPKGLWLSDEDDYGWRQWCEDEDFGTDRLAVAHEVVLADDARILVLSNAADLDKFTILYGDGKPHSYFIDWPALAEHFHGILITPYIGERRMARHAAWYYPWDCASGCIWDPAAVASIAVVADEALAS